jgi:hypothetical protein
MTPRRRSYIPSHYASRGSRVRYREIVYLGFGALAFALIAVAVVVLASQS